MRQDLSILIQGPVNSISLAAIDHYRQFGKIVVSCWRTDKLSLLADIRDITIVCTDEPEDFAQQLGRTAAPGNGFRSTFYRAITGLHLGMSVCDTPYILRTRSDERYNIAPMIAKFEQLVQDGCSRIVCGNIFFRKGGTHIGDHVYIGSTVVLREAIKNLYGFHRGIVNDDFFVRWCAERIGGKHAPGSRNSAENAVCHSILHAFGVSADNIEPERVLPYMQACFSVIDVNSLSPFIAQCNADHLTFENHFDAEKYGCVTDEI